MEPFALLIAIFIFTAVGSLLGICTGLLPGLHINTVACMVVAAKTVFISATAYLFGWLQPSGEELLIIISALIIGNLIVHSFLDFIPSIFLGAPEGDTALSVLPAHRLLLAGRGYEAVRCTALGAVCGVVASIALIIPVRFLIGSPIYGYEKVWHFIPYILMLIVAILILAENDDTCRFSKKVILKGNLIDVATAARGYLLKISELQKNIGRRIVVQGKVTRVASNNYFFISDSSAEILVCTNEPHNAIHTGRSVFIMGSPTKIQTFTGNIYKKALALAIFFIAGWFGYVILCTPGLITANIYLLYWYPLDIGILLFPMLTGLFGISTLLISISTNPKLPEQKIVSGIELEKKRKKFSILNGTFAGGLVAFFPGVTAAQGTILAKVIAGRTEEDEKNLNAQKEFIIALAAVGVTNAIFNLVALFVILKARSGAMRAVSYVLEDNVFIWEPINFVPVGLAALLFAVCIAAGLGYIYTLYFGRKFAKMCNNIPYRKLGMSVLVLLIILILLFSGILGICIALVATFIGLLPPLLGVSRVHLMGCLILPIILYFFGV
jgi:TctA family transporter